MSAGLPAYLAWVADETRITNVNLLIRLLFLALSPAWR